MANMAPIHTRHQYLRLQLGLVSPARALDKCRWNRFEFVWHKKRPSLRPCRISYWDAADCSDHISLLLVAGMAAGEEIENGNL
jgi:hypothetical protein